MKVALIIMSILGCDDSGTQCVPVAAVPDRWTTIAACDAESEKHLALYTTAKYPMIVAVCQTANKETEAESTEDNADALADSKALTETRKASLTERAITLVTDALPTTEGIKDIVVKPLHIVSDTYSWVARKITD